MNKLYLISLLILLSCNTYSISYEDIKENPQYVWGEGTGHTIADAERDAMSAISNSIIINISNSSEMTSSDDDVNFNSKIQSYTQSSLTNTQRIIISNEPDAHVFMYIKKSEIQKMFDDRLKRALYLIEDGKTALNKGKIDQALRNFYWSYSLVRSLQYPNKAMYNEHQLISWLPQQIRDILDDITVNQLEQNNLDIKIQIFYKDKLINTLDYTFFDGINWSNIYGANSGVGLIELRPGASTEDLKIKCEYEYRNEAHIDAEIESVMKIIKPTYFNEAYKTVQTIKAEETLASDDNSVSSQANHTEDLYSTDSTKDYDNIIHQLTQYIELKEYTKAKPLFTEDGYKTYTQLLKYGNAKIIDKSNLMFYEYNGNVQCRGIMAHFAFNTNKRKFIEELSIEFNTDNLISNIAFGLGEQAKADILNKKTWAEHARMILVNFMETYKTAFALKRIDYIESIFDDNAVIIVGNEVRKPKNTDQGSFINSKAVKYTRYSKEDYIKKLRYCFTRNEYINIRFANNDIIKLGGMGGEVYGIQIKQDYYSTNYGDTGYLFLLVDLNDPKNPIIKVRTWQPYRNEEFGKDGLIGAEDF